MAFWENEGQATKKRHASFQELRPNVENAVLNPVYKAVAFFFAL